MAELVSPPKWQVHGFRQIAFERQTNIDCSSIASETFAPVVGGGVLASETRATILLLARQLIERDLWLIGFAGVSFEDRTWLF